MKICSFSECNRPLCARGLCNTHWSQQNNGRELTPIRTEETQEERFWRQTEKGLEPDDCWLFTGNGNGAGQRPTGIHRGYGQLFHNGTKVMAHRYSYELLVGPIPDEYHLDHLCRQRNCVNPKHLEPLVQGDNNRRMLAFKGMSERIEKLENFIESLGYNPISLERE